MPGDLELAVDQEIAACDHAISYGQTRKHCEVLARARSKCQLSGLEESRRLFDVHHLPSSAVKNCRNGDCKYTRPACKICGLTRRYHFELHVADRATPRLVIGLFTFALHWAKILGCGRDGRCRSWQGVRGVLVLHCWGHRAVWDFLQGHLAHRTTARRFCKYLGMHWASESALNTRGRGTALFRQRCGDYRGHEHSRLERVILIIHVDRPADRA